MPDTVTGSRQPNTPEHQHHSRACHREVLSRLHNLDAERTVSVEEAVAAAGDRENQILALPGGGLLLLDANMNPINGGIYGATAWTPQQLLNPDWTYLVAGDSVPNPNALGTVNSVYGPTASAATQGPAGSNILNVTTGMNAWPFNEADPAGYHPETWTSTLSILVQQPPTP